MIEANHLMALINEIRCYRTQHEYVLFYYIIFITFLCSINSLRVTQKRKIYKFVRPIFMCSSFFIFNADHEVVCMQFLLIISSSCSHAYHSYIFLINFPTVLYTYIVSRLVSCWLLLDKNTPKCVIVLIFEDGNSGHPFPNQHPKDAQTHSRFCFYCLFKTASPMQLTWVS